MKNSIHIFLILVLFLGQSCKNKDSKVINKLPIPTVTVVHPTLEKIHDKVQINGQVVYLNKTNIKAPISGYVTRVNTKLGNWVKKGSILFKIQTKESKALQDSNLAIDENFGIIPIYATISGYVNLINITDSGVFINEGNPLATIVKSNDLVIQVNTPFQYYDLLKVNKKIEISLSNKKIVFANFYKALPIIDPVSQTQQVYFKLIKHKELPENLNVIVNLQTKQKPAVITLPKDAVLTNETQNEFWIMEINKDSLAVKIMIQKGLENNGKVEIVSPKLELQSLIIKKGAYGLPDSTKVKIN
ncbi:HlyD family efflux transporter periplasmic adaptor subunit [Lutibacter sp.]|uniref:efflux RND transporter periplasmic adaptor subunit n=1 Tax=Lutibacter sp. TaxID=1925666 RepID=UPI0025C469C2|nr:HlyD family efflux transporter periplasmic adaptor subunit [Lutibacter sp.]MCF6182435.1 HlyD family efflux transporter periplasmic adaptor subunit [Lutibacter sp.]